jgi:hypothetical protein
MKVRETLQKIRSIRIPKVGYPVESTVAHELLESIGSNAAIKRISQTDMKSDEGIFYIAVADKDLTESLVNKEIELPSDKEWVFFSIDDKKCCWLLSSKSYFLYSAFSYLMENFLDRDVSHLRGCFREMSFSVEKSTFDIFLTQYARIIRDFRRERYIREYARLGLTHVEVNALSTPVPKEEGTKGEFYSHFYTYCPALDQFVSSRLNQGIYPQEYLNANLALLKENASLAVKYGLVPGLLCFEPRSVPETLFQRYPTLRGARVDHPFRSLKPRFNLSVAHPVVQNHYTELITNLLMEVPALEFLSIWSNDSGAGFEHTKSLYVGRNGGAYLIREWKDDEEIANAAALNIINFFTLLRDSASRINPRFRVSTRLESFYGEHQYLWPKLEDRIDVEANSLLARGWESNYAHPHYPDVNVSGSVYHSTLQEKERGPLEELESRGSYCFFYHSFGSHANHEPLLGIPFPWLTHEKLIASYKLKARALAHLGGIQPPDKVPFAANQEVFREFQFNPQLDIDKTVFNIAEQYAGKEQAEDLVKAWKWIEQAVRHFMPLPLYSHYGLVWQRLLVRPLVPHIERIPENERAYYEKFMCTSIHNPNRIDLAQDVLFELVSKDYARKAFTRIDAHVWEPLANAVDLLRKKMELVPQMDDNHDFSVFEDQYFRIRALRCLYETLRNTAVWIYAVHEYLESTDPQRKAECRTLLEEMVDREILNCRELLRLWKEAPIEWMIISGTEETPFIHGENFPKLLKKKIALMEKHKHDEPYIDPDYMFRIPNNPYE